MLNRKYFIVTARYIPTNRIRIVKVWARSEKEVKKELLASDYSEIVSITRNIFPPSERQISYAQSLGITITPDMESHDVSALISRSIDDKSDPNPGLIDFAENRNIVFSSFIGKKGLYNIVFSNLPIPDKIAFFTFSIYRYVSSDREANLDKSPHKAKFYEFAHSIESNERLVHSLLNNYNGEDLRFFGTLHIDSYNPTYGGSKKTSIYKSAVKFLLNEKLLTQEEVSATKRLHTLKNKSNASNDNYASDPSCDYSNNNSNHEDNHLYKNNQMRYPVDYTIEFLSNKEFFLICLFWIVVILLFFSLF